MHAIVSDLSFSIRGLPSTGFSDRWDRCGRWWFAGQPLTRLLFLSLFGAVMVLWSLSASAAAILVLPNDPLEDLDNFGQSVAADGNTLVISKNGDNTQGLSSGAVYIFEFDGSNQLVQVAKVLGDGGNFDRLGDSVAIEGDVMAVGATGDDDVANSAGAVYVFERDAGGAGNWGRTAKLTASDGGADQSFGFTVDVSGDRIVVGTLFETDVAENFGAAYVFEKEGGQWVENAKLEPVNPDPQDNFGIAVAISGDTAVVGADARDEVGGFATSAPGTAYVFERGGGQWGQTARLSAGEQSDLFGGAVGISGEILAVGAPGHNEGAASSTGAVYIFEPDGGGQWSQTAKVLPSGIQEQDRFGKGLEVSGNAFAAGAIGTEVNNRQAAGAAYVFERSDSGPWTQVAKLNRDNPARNDAFGGRIAFGGGNVVVGIIDAPDIPVVQVAGGGAAFAFTVPVTPPPPPPPPPPEYEDIFSGGADAGGGWHESSWFGFYNVNFDPWIFHLEHGWTFVEASSTPDSMFLFDLSSGAWYFTGQALYPNLFSFGRNAWVFYFAGTSNPRNYVDLASGEFFDLE